MLELPVRRLIGRSTHELTTRSCTAPHCTARLLRYRYNSFSTINKVQTAPTIQSLDDSAIIRKYGSRAGWNANRTYSIVVAPNKGYTCGLFNEADDLFLTTTAADGVIANQWAILDRQLIPKFTRDGQPDRSITYARTQCGKMGDDLACVKPDVLHTLLGDYYPCEYPPVSITCVLGHRDNALTRTCGRWSPTLSFSLPFSQSLHGIFLEKQR